MTVSTEQMLVETPVTADARAGERASVPYPSSGRHSENAAVKIETRVIKAVREHLNLDGSNDDTAIIKAHVIRVEVQVDQLAVQLVPAQNLSAAQSVQG